MGASLRPWLGQLPAWQAYPALLQNVDANWIVATRYRAEGGGDVSIYLGSGLALWVIWVAAVIPGHLLGAFFKDPTRFGFDMMLPIFFSAMLGADLARPAPRDRLGHRGRGRARGVLAHPGLLVHRHRCGDGQHRRGLHR